MKRRFVLLATVAALAAVPVIAFAKPPVKVPKPSCTWVNDRNGGHIVCKK